MANRDPSLNQRSARPGKFRPAMGPPFQTSRKSSLDELSENGAAQVAAQEQATDGGAHISSVHTEIWGFLQGARREGRFPSRPMERPPGGRPFPCSSSFPPDPSEPPSLLRRERTGDRRRVWRLCRHPRRERRELSACGMNSWLSSASCGRSRPTERASLRLGSRQGSRT